LVRDVELHPGAAYVIIERRISGSYLLIHNLPCHGETVPLDIGKAQITTLNTTMCHITCILINFINAELDKFNQCLDLEKQRAYLNDVLVLEVGHHFLVTYLQLLLTKVLMYCRLHLKCDGTRAKIIFHILAIRTSPFKSAGVSVQSTTGS
jgi:hypothetical protein